MIRLAVTIDVQGAIQVIEGKVHHVDYEQSVHIPCFHLAQIAERYGLKITFFVPLGELLDDHPQVISLLSSLTAKHDCQALVHLAVPLMKEEEIVQRLLEEKSIHERYLGRPPKAIRAGGHNVGFGRKWMDCIKEAGYAIDSSVFPGASTIATWAILAKAAPTEESRWGTRSLQFDFRGAPLTGSYFAHEDNISRPGNSSLVEVPVTVREYSERRPFLYRFDFQHQDVAGLRSTISHFLDEEALEEELVVNLATQSAGNIYSLRWRRWQRCGPNYRLNRFEAFARWLNHVYLGDKVASITIGDIDPHAIRPLVRWSREQPEYFGGRTIRDNSALGDPDYRKDRTTMTLGEATIHERIQSSGVRAFEEYEPQYIPMVHKTTLVHGVLARLGWARRVIMDMEQVGMACQIPFVYGMMRRLAWARRLTANMVLSVLALLCLLVMLPWALRHIWALAGKGKHRVAEEHLLGQSYPNHLNVRK